MFAFNIQKNEIIGTVFGPFCEITPKCRNGGHPFIVGQLDFLFSCVLVSFVPVSNYIVNW